MVIQINFKSGKPAYLQIVDQVKHAAASGGLKPGEALPSIRPLAEKLRINRNTVAKAYTELERQGIIATQTGRGSYITNNGSPLKKAIRTEILNEAVDAAIVQAHHFQIKEEDLLKVVHERLEHFKKQNS